MTTHKLKGKNIIVTGATSGIGKSLTLKLIDLGANVAFCGRNENKANQLVSEIKSEQNNFYYKCFDATMESDIICFVKEVSNYFGELDILVNCAGANSSRALISELKTEDLEWMLKVNLIAPFVFMREVLKFMPSDKHGLFINVLSTVSNFSNEGIGAYTASKAGFDALTKVIRKEVREQNKKVCSIYPGGVDTPFRKESRPKYLNSNSVADAILSMMLYDENTSIDELTIRPMIEKKYS